jgi:hypothetical protein
MKTVIIIVAVVVAVLAIILGVLASIDIPAPSRQIEKTIPADRMIH